MATTIKLGEKVTVGTTATEYVIDESDTKVSKPLFDATIYTESDNSGTIQFSVGVTPPAGQKLWAAATSDVSFIIKGVQNGVYNIWAKGSAAGQKFTIV